MRSVVVLLWLLTLTLFVGESVAVGYLADTNVTNLVASSGGGSAAEPGIHHRAEMSLASDTVQSESGDHGTACASMGTRDDLSKDSYEGCDCSAGACDCIINLGLAMPLGIALSPASGPIIAGPILLRYGSIPSKEWHPPFRPPIA